MPTKFAMVGSGWMANAIAPDFAACAGVELAALVGRSRLHGRSFATEWGIPVLTIAELADTDIDVVYIATPHDSHLALATAALDAGKHVLVEKAFTMNAAQARELVALAQRRGRFLMEAMWMRFNPAIIRARQLLDDGAIGEPRTLYASFGSPVPSDGGSRLWDPARAGGSLLDQGVYPLTLADIVFGASPQTVSATGSRLGFDGEDAGVDTELAVLLGYSGGAQAIASTSIRSMLPLRAAVGGRDGLIEFDEAFWSDTSFVLRRPGREPERFELAKEGNGYVPMLRGVHEAIENGWSEHPRSPLDATIRVLEVVDRVRASIERSESPSGSNARQTD